MVAMVASASQYDIRRNTSGAILWGLADNQGTIRDVVSNTTKAVVDHRKYDSFGNATSNWAATDFVFGCTGQAWDDVAKLYNYGHRWYDPTVGRFLGIRGTRTDIDILRKTQRMERRRDKPDH
jgi:hypothetical protein